MSPSHYQNWFNTSSPSIHTTCILAVCHCHHCLSYQSYASVYAALLQKTFQQRHNLTKLKVFIYLCYPCLCLNTTHKLDLKSNHCVLLGYSLTHSAFLCYDPRLQKILYLAMSVLSNLSFLFLPSSLSLPLIFHMFLIPLIPYIYYQFFFSRVLASHHQRPWHPNHHNLSSYDHLVEKQYTQTQSQVWPSYYTILIAY